jgi:hypothetical protein
VVEPTPGAGPRYDRGVIWEPFVLALFLGLIVSAGLYFAYLWPSVEPSEAEPVMAAADSPMETDAVAEPTPEGTTEAAAGAAEPTEPVADEASPAS